MRLIRLRETVLIIYILYKILNAVYFFEALFFPLFFLPVSYKTDSYTIYLPYPDSKYYISNISCNYLPELIKCTVYLEIYENGSELVTSEFTTFT
jgi:hypothetical protein